MARLTDWIAPEVKPALPGWYSRKYSSEWMRKYHDYWDGERWLLDGNKSQPAVDRLPWCGLAKDPNIEASTQSTSAASTDTGSET